MNRLSLTCGVALVALSAASAGHFCLEAKLRDGKTVKGYLPEKRATFQGVTADGKTVAVRLEKLPDYAKRDWSQEILWDEALATSLSAPAPLSFPPCRLKTNHGRTTNPNGVNGYGFSFLYLCIGQRLRMPLCLVRAPEHAFVRYEGPGERFNIETTQEGKLHDADDYLREYWGEQRFSQVGGTHLASLPVPSALCSLFLTWGNALCLMGKAPEACEKYAKAVEINPRHAEAYWGWGAALHRMGKTAEACEKYPKAVESNPRLAVAYCGWGAALHDMGKFAETCEKCAKAVEINPRLAGAYFNWGLALAGLRKNAEAMEKLEMAAKIDPMLRPKVEVLLADLVPGKVPGDTGSSPNPCEKYAQAVESKPRDAAAYCAWGAELNRMGKYGDASWKFSKAIEIDPNRSEAYAGWGVALAGVGHHERACEKYAKAVEIDPKHAAAWFDWGVALSCLDKNAAAMEKLNKAAELDPTLKPKVEELRKELLGKK